ncbi:porin family protein [Alteromonas mediterranea]|uniref:porin family protein n=1 Tax=Alteromonas mediterranea TaxID=314275 RepID=UPI0012FB0CD6|nr:porin family protein [Alteromonas mediterranea]QGX63322.1 outer membrane beta-barrel protein [Alteromonas mediterranea]
MISIEMTTRLKLKVIGLGMLSTVFSSALMAQESSDERDLFPLLASKTQCLSDDDAARLMVEREKCTANQFFIGASWGSASGDFKESDVQQEAADLGFNVFDIDIDDTRSAWKAVVGTNISENTFIQLGYTDLGDVSAAFSTTTNEPSRFFGETSRIRPTSVDGYTLSVAYQFLRHENWYLHAHLGLYFWQGDYDSLDVFEDETLLQDLNDEGTDLYYGVGANWRISGEWTASIEYERYDIDNNPTDLISLGVNYLF